jgi:hypothetical protein
VVSDPKIVEELQAMGVKGFLPKSGTLPSELKSQIDKILGDS